MFEREELNCSKYLQLIRLQSSSFLFSASGDSGFGRFAVWKKASSSGFSACGIKKLFASLSVLEAVAKEELKGMSYSA